MSESKDFVLFIVLPIPPIMQTRQIKEDLSPKDLSLVTDRTGLEHR